MKSSGTEKPQLLNWRRGARVWMSLALLGSDIFSFLLADAPLVNLILIDFQPFERMPDNMASAGILISILEPEAGVYSVPSKVQTYLCGKKLLLLSVPVDNLIAQIVE